MFINGDVDDFGNCISVKLPTSSVLCWYISMSAYGGFEKWDGWASPIV
jgi:hypothetical protein